MVSRSPYPTCSPCLHDLGVTVTDERPNEIRAAHGVSAWIYDFGLTLPLGADGRGERRRAFEDAFLAAWEGRAESDGFNHLVLTAGLTWREVVVLRAYRRYLRQIGSTFSQAYYEQTLRAHPRVVRLIVDAFRARFDPANEDDRDGSAEQCMAELASELDLVPSLDEDRMLRSFCTLVAATVRTNHFQTAADGQPKSELALKLDPSQIPDMPLPRRRMRSSYTARWSRASTCEPGEWHGAAFAGQTDVRTSAPRSSV